MGHAERIQAGEQAPVSERFLQAGVISDDLQLATIQVAGMMGRSWGNKKFDEIAAKALETESLPAVWQSMAVAQEQALAIRQTARGDSETEPETYNPFSLVEQILDQAYAIHTNQSVLEQSVAQGGLRRKLRKRLIAKKAPKQQSETTAQPPEPAEESPQLKSSESFEILSGNPAIAEKLQAIQLAEKAYAAEMLQFENAKDRIASHQTAQDNGALDSAEGLARITKAVREKFSAEPAGQVLSTRREALDTIVAELVPEYPESGKATVPLNDENLPYIAAVLALAHFTSQQIPEWNAIEDLDNHAVELHNLTTNNPKRLVHVQKDDLGIVRMDEGSGPVLEVRSSRDESQRLDVSLFINHCMIDRYNGSSGEPCRGLKVRSTDLLTYNSLNNAFQFDYLWRAAWPARDFSTYARSQAIHDPLKLYESLGEYFKDEWDEMPELEGQIRLDASEKYKSDQLQPFLWNVWNHCCMNAPTDYLGEAAGRGTAHELVDDPEIIRQLAKLETKVWMVKDPIAAQAELRIMGIDAQGLTSMMQEQVLQNIYRANVDRRFISRYTGVISNYINSIFGSEVQPAEIVSEQEAAWATTQGRFGRLRR